MITPVSVYMRPERSRIHWQYGRWHETGLETSLKPLSQMRSNVFEKQTSRIMTTPVSVYMRSVRSRLHWQYRLWHETGLETTLKPLLQIGSDVSENELRTV